MQTCVRQSLVTVHARFDVPYLEVTTTRVRMGIPDQNGPQQSMLVVRGFLSMDRVARHGVSNESGLIHVQIYYLRHSRRTIHTTQSPRLQRSSEINTQEYE